jgi:uncharacterized protein YndB with AHSA1/START domain
MSDLGEVVQIAAVRFERVLPGPLERVWRHLTDCAHLTGWYGEDGSIEPREGGAVRLMGGHIRGVVTQWKPHRRLAYTWNVFDPGDEESRYRESYLTFELQAEGDHVALRLLHLPVPERMEPQTRMGWHTYLDMLGAVVEGAPLELREAYMMRNAPRYGVDLNNLQR